jgi:hypothetical protein
MHIKANGEWIFHFRHPEGGAYKSLIANIAEKLKKMKVYADCGETLYNFKISAGRKQENNLSAYRAF